MLVGVGRRAVTIRPRIEVQHANAALQLAARGVGDTLVTRALLDAFGYRDDLAAVSLDPPLHATFAFIQRRNARLSPATRSRSRVPPPVRRASYASGSRHLRGISRR